jgi:hypothetical protein
MPHMRDMPFQKGTFTPLNFPERTLFNVELIFHCLVKGFGGRIRGLDAKSQNLGMGQLFMKILMMAGLDTKNQP